MKTGRPDLDAKIRISSIPDEEPSLVVRGRDPACAVTARAYGVASWKIKAPVAVIEQVLQQADRIAAWPHKKPVDDDHLTAAQRKQLEYQFSRRAREYFADQDFLAEEPQMFAWRVGHDEAMGKARHVQAQARAVLYQAWQKLTADPAQPDAALALMDTAMTLLEGGGE